MCCKEIGSWDKTSLDGLPDLGIIISSATFHILGTYFNQKKALLTEVSLITAFQGSFFSIFPVIKANAGTLFSD